MNEAIQQLSDLFKRSTQNIIANIEDIDAVLDNRDADAFSDPWNEAYRETADTTIAGVEEEQIRNIRKAIFLQVMSKTKSSDLSAYLSDDFELICLHLLTGSKNKWVAALWAAYFTNEIPQSKLGLSDQTLNELVKEHALKGED